jgi:hypothetical protein
VGNKVMSERLRGVRRAAEPSSNAAAQSHVKRRCAWGGGGVEIKWMVVVCKSYLGEVEMLEGAALVVPALISLHPRH